MSGQKPTKKKIFNLDLDIETRMRDYTTTNQMSEAAFIRLAIIEKLNRAQTEQNGMQQSTQVHDLPTIELAIQELTNQQAKLIASMDYLIERTQGVEQQPEIEKEVLSAKAELVEKQPTTYQQASIIISNVDIMNEAITQLLTENKVVYKRRKLVWS